MLIESGLSRVIKVDRSSFMGILLGLLEKFTLDGAWTSVLSLRAKSISDRAQFWHHCQTSKLDWLFTEHSTWIKFRRHFMLAPIAIKPSNVRDYDSSASRAARRNRKAWEPRFSHHFSLIKQLFGIVCGSLWAMQWNAFGSMSLIFIWRARKTKRS